MAPAGRPSVRDLTAAPNLVTLSRLALVPVALLLMSADQRIWAAVVVAAAFATDGLDGYLARRLKRVTELGKILDPLADKVAVAAVLIYLTAAREFPAWALAVIVARDVGIAAGGARMARRTGVVPAALLPGKVALVVLAAMVFVFVLDLAPAEPVALVLGTAATVWSGAFYALVMRRAAGGGRGVTDTGSNGGGS
jgi:CDP-diacylglycerol--glycerol-3-phosphate 3-phosphatidyltransferase